jgi:2-phospho-L-lactate guanylyltransferase
VTVSLDTSLDSSGIEASSLLGQRAVLIPVKAFRDAKKRLETALSSEERKQLVRTMAEQVVRASEPLPVAIVCDDTEVAIWARERGLLVIWEPGRGLNGAVELGVQRLGDLGVQEVTVAHADLPKAAHLGELAPFEGITLIPDRREDGTNVIRLPVGCGFHFSYGPGSFARHQMECRRIGLAWRVQNEPDLTFDVDWPADLAWTRNAPDR